MLVAALVAAVAILAGVVAVTLGRGGEMVAFGGDAEPIDLGLVTGADVALFRPPMALWGYNMQATDDALGFIATSVSARDTEIAELMQATEDALEVIGKLVSARDSEIADLRHRLTALAGDPARLRADGEPAPAPAAIEQAARSAGNASQ